MRDNLDDVVADSDRFQPPLTTDGQLPNGVRRCSIRVWEQMKSRPSGVGQLAGCAPELSAPVRCGRPSCRKGATSIRRPPRSTLKLWAMLEPRIDRLPAVAIDHHKLWPDAVGRGQTVVTPTSVERDERAIR
jgi:hypothetical protein